MSPTFTSSLMYPSELSWPRTSGTQDHIRAADIDRDRMETVLKQHHDAGRLTMEELAERLAACRDARTLGELRALAADLPGDPDFAPRSSEHREPRHHGWRGRRRVPRWMPFAIVMAILFATRAIGGWGWHGGHGPHGAFSSHQHHGRFPWGLLVMAAVFFAWRRSVWRRRRWGW